MAKQGPAGEPKRRRRRYSDDDRAAALAALAANGGNLKGTARQVGVPEPTLRHWSRDATRQGAKVEAQKTALADQFEALAERLLAVAESKIGEASFVQLMTGAGIAVDKMLLLRERSTTNNATADPGAQVVIYLPDNGRGGTALPATPPTGGRL
jgi:transposase-like protein